MPLRLSEFWQELKDRRVVRVAIGYTVVAAVIVQAADLTFEPLGLPAWTYTFVLVLALAGFPVAMVLAWAFDVTPAGIERVGAEGIDTDLFAVVPFRVSSGDESLRSMLREGVLDILAP